MRLLPPACLLLLALGSPGWAQEEPKERQRAKAWAGLLFGPTPQGAPAAIRVINTPPGSPAAVAGLRPGDLISKIDGVLGDPPMLKRILSFLQPGDALRLEVLRPSGSASVTLTLEPFDVPTLVDRSLHLGAKRLAAAQDAQGAWRRKGDVSAGGDASLTVLCARTLAGLPPALREAHLPAAEHALGFVLEHQSPVGAIVADASKAHYRTYTSALALQVLCMLDRRIPAREGLQAWLLDAQLDREAGMSEYDFERYGGWNTFDQNARATLNTDVSVTSFAIEALGRAGLQNTRAAKQALVFLRRTQNLSPSGEPDPTRDGGFPNSPRSSKAGMTVLSSGEVRQRSYGSTTADGVRSLLRLGVPREDRRVQAGVSWLADHFAVRENPNFPEDRVERRLGIYYYYLQSMSDALSLYSRRILKTSDGHELDWAKLISLRLITIQRPDGAWVGSAPLMNEDDPNLASCWALLALSRCRPFLEPVQ